MSLLQHVSSIDGVDRERRYSIDEPPRSIRRVLSYDAFPPDKPKEIEEVAAYKVSTPKRFVQVVVTVLICWFASGIVFGFAALKPVLLNEGVYRELCTEKELRNGVEVCEGQDIRLNLFFTIASITANISALPVGTVLDRYGARVCNIIGSVFFAVGCLLMAYAFAIPEFDGYILGNFFLSLGGTFIFVPSFQIANAFPKYSGTIVALVTGAFDASAAVYLFYRLAYEASNRSFRPERFFFGYLVVPVLIFVAQVTLMPAHDYQSFPQLEAKIEKAMDVTRDVHDSDDEIDSDTELRRVRSHREHRRQDKIKKLDELLGDEDERLQRAEREEERHETSRVWGVLHGQPAHVQMLSPWFILITLLTVLQMLRMNYFIATIRSQYEYMLDSDVKAARINRFFDVALPVGGVVSTPFIGLLLDNLSVQSMLALIVALVTVVGILNAVPFMWAGYVTVTLFVLLRPLYYSAMSDYAAKVFGFATFGRVYGTIICLSGLVNFSQYGIDSLTHGPFHNNPTPINAFFAVAGFIVGCVLVAFVHVKSKRVKRIQLEEDAVDERERLIIPEEDEDDEEFADYIVRDFGENANGHANGAPTIRVEESEDN